MHIVKYRHTRFFAVYDAAGELVVVTVYKRGAQEVVRRLIEIGSIGEMSKEALVSADAFLLRPNVMQKRNEKEHG